MRATIGPFSLQTDQELDQKIINFFESARSRGKAALFREVMKFWFGSHDCRIGQDRIDALAPEQIMAVGPWSSVTVDDKLDQILRMLESGTITRLKIDSHMSKAEDDPLLAKAEAALDALGA